MPLSVDGFMAATRRMRLERRDSENKFGPRYEEVQREAADTIEEVACADRTGGTLADAIEAFNMTVRVAGNGGYQE
jgi:hypothetical protein